MNETFVFALLCRRSLLKASCMHARLSMLNTLPIDRIAHSQSQAFSFFVFFSLKQTAVTVSCGSWLCPGQPIVFSSLLPRPAKKPYTLHTPMHYLRRPAARLLLLSFSYVAVLASMDDNGAIDA